MFNSNELWSLVLVFAFAFLAFISYAYFPTFLGYDSYFFLEAVCGEGVNYFQASLSTVPPLAKLVFDALPCDVFLIKALWGALFLASLLIIYYTTRLVHGREAWRAIPFVMIFPVFLLNSLKIENDPLAYPIMFLSFYFFLKYLKSGATIDLGFLNVRNSKRTRLLLLSLILI